MVREKKIFLAFHYDRLLFLIILIYEGDRRWASINKRIEPLHMTHAQHVGRGSYRS